MTERKQSSQLHSTDSAVHHVPFCWWLRKTTLPALECRKHYKAAKQRPTGANFLRTSWLVHKKFAPGGLCTDWLWHRLTVQCWKFDLHYRSFYCNFTQHCLTSVEDHTITWCDVFRTTLRNHNWLRVDKTKFKHKPSTVVGGAQTLFSQFTHSPRARCFRFSQSLAELAADSVNSGWEVTKLILENIPSRCVPTAKLQQTQFAPKFH